MTTTIVNDVSTPTPTHNNSENGCFLLEQYETTLLRTIVGGGEGGFMITDSECARAGAWPDLC